MKLSLPFLSLFFHAALASKAGIVATISTAERPERSLQQVFEITDPSTPLQNNFVVSSSQTTCYVTCGDFAPTWAGDRFLIGSSTIGDLNSNDNTYFVHGYDGSGGHNYLTSTNTDPVCSSDVSFDFELSATLFSGTDDRTMAVEVVDENGFVVLSVPVLQATAPFGVATFASVTVTIDLSGPVFNGCLPNGNLRFAWYIPDRFSGPAQFVLDNVMVEPLAPLVALPQFGGLNSNTWNIGVPVDGSGNPDPIQYDAVTSIFSSTFLHGPGSGSPNANMRIFATAGAPTAGSAADSCMTNGGVEVGAAGSIPWLDLETFTPFANLGGIDSTYIFGIDPSVDDYDVTSAGTNGYAVYASTVGSPDLLVSFCVVFGLTDPAHSGDTISFYEVGVEVTIDLTNQFSITGFETQAIAPTTDTASNDYEVFYVGCPLPAANNPFDQFEVISVCLCPSLASAPNGMTSGAIVTMVENVEVEGALPGGGGNTVTQAIFTNGQPATAASGQYPLTGALQGCFQVDFLTDDSFFPTNGGSTATVPLTITGNVVLTLNRRRLGGERTLQEQEESADFQIPFDVVPGEKSNSGAALSVVTLTGVAAAAGVAGAALLL